MRTALPRQERVSKRTIKPLAAELTKPELTKPLATERADAQLTAASVARGLVVRVERDTKRHTKRRERHTKRHVSLFVLLNL
jgi:hypothetical protein